MKSRERLPKTLVIQMNKKKGLDSELWICQQLMAIKHEKAIFTQLPLALTQRWWIKSSGKKKKIKLNERKKG